MIRADILATKNDETLVGWHQYYILSEFKDMSDDEIVSEITEIAKDDFPLYKQITVKICRV